MNASLNKTQIITIVSFCLCIHAFFLFALVSGGIVLEPKEFPRVQPFDEEREEWVAMQGYGLGAPVLFADQEFLNDEPINAEQTILKHAPEQLVTHLQQNSSSYENKQNSPSTHATQTAVKPEQTAMNVSAETPEKNDSTIQKEQSPAPPKMTKSQSNALTFAKLATGFMQYMKNPAHIPSGITVHSKKKGVVSDKQIARMNFEQKLLSCIVNSYQIHRLEAPKRLQRQRAAVALALNRDGSIYALEIIHSSGIPEIDRFIMTFFRDTQDSFPPIPQQFNAPYHLPVIAFDDVRLFQSPQYWYYASNQ